MRLWPALIYVVLSGPALGDGELRLGVFGTVDRVDPLVVAGREIDFPNDVPVISPLGPNKPILQGDTLAITATFTEGRLVAQRVREIYPVIGPVISVSERTAIVMGSAVHVPPDVDLAAGRWIAVSGLWSGDKAITSNIRRVDSGFAQLTGAVVGDVPMVGSSKILSAAPPAEGFGNDIWLFSGTAENSGLRATLTSKGVFSGQVDLVLWQGYASLPVASQTYMIHGFGIIGFARDAQMPQAGALIARCAREGRVVSIAPGGLGPAFEALECARYIQGD